MMAFSYSPPNIMQLIAAVPRGAYSFERLNKTYNGDLINIQDGGGGANHYVRAEWMIPLSGMNVSNAYLRHFYDQSGNGRHMTNDAGGQMQNGTAPLKVGPRYVANFDGAFKRHDDIGLSGDTAVTVALVFGEFVADGAVWSFGQTVANKSLVLYQYGSGGTWTFDTSSGGAGRQFSKPSTATGMHAVIARKGAGESSATWSVRQDGAELTPLGGSVGNVNLDVPVAFLAAMAVQMPFGGVKMKACEWIVWGTKLTDRELIDLEAWLARKRIV